MYTVKSRYWLGTHLPTNVPTLPTQGSVDLKHKIWKTKAPAKLKYFLWRLLSGFLAKGNNLRRRHITQNELCRRCCSVEETENHLFFECPYALGIWRASGVSNLTITNSSTNLEEKIAACLQFSSSSRLEHFQDLPLWILWMIWKSRHILVFQQKETHWRTLLRYAKEDAKEWKHNGTMDVPNQTRREEGIYLNKNMKWEGPPEEWKKCNTDGTFYQQTRKATAGWVIRDENGVYKGSAQARGRRVQDALESELQAILMALQHCWSLGYDRIILESDCQKAI